MSAQQILIAKYGQPDAAYQSAKCIVWEVQKDFPWFPTAKFLVNKDFKDMLFKAFTNLVKTNCHTQIKTFDGCYNDRSVRGMNSTSLHAWASAIDINAAIEPMGDPTTHFTAQFIAIMQAQNIFWGGNFISRKDGMHFAQFNG